MVAHTLTPLEAEYGSSRHIVVPNLTLRPHVNLCRAKQRADTVKCQSNQSNDCTQV